MPLIPWRTYLPSAFLLLALLLGGGTLGGPLANLLLQILAVAVIIALALFGGRDHERTAAERSLDRLFLLAAWLFALSLVPLPPALWTLLPGRDTLAQGFRLIGEPLPWLPLSMTPADTLWSGLSLVPLAAIAMLVRRAPAEAGRAMIATILLFAATSALLGIAQFLAGRESALYLFAVTNRGFAVGFFANANHLASLCAAAIPLAAVYFGTGSSGRRARGSRKWEKVGLIALFDVLMLTACWLTDSFAGLALCAAGLAASPVLFGSINVRPTLFWAGSAASIAAIVAAFAFAVAQPGTMAAGASQHGTDRATIYPRALSAMADHMPVGSGLGSFARVYPAYEDPARVTYVYANHAHSDLIEWLSETGVAGGLLLLALAGWVILWVARSFEFSTSASRVARAAFVALTLMGLHSLVDYPLRTAALATMAVAMLALIARLDWERS